VAKIRHRLVAKSVNVRLFYSVIGHEMARIEACSESIALDWAIQIVPGNPARSGALPALPSFFNAT